MSIPGLSDGADPAGTTFGTQFTREAPQIEARKLQLMDTASGFAKDPVTIPGQQVSPFTDLQNEAFTRTQQGLGKFQPYLNTATQQLLDSTAAYDPTTAYKQYMNPYQNEVISGIEQQFDKMENQANLSAAQAGAFGGARQGIQTAELGRQRADAVGQAQAQNYGQAQQQAQAQFSNQMQRQQTAAQGIAGLGAQQQALQQGDIASAMSAGSVQQQQAQQISDAQYRQQLQQLYEPYQRLGFVSDIYQGMPSSGMSTTMGTSPMTNPLAQAVGTGITGLAGYQALKGS
jgi:hypothetical protein|tara:strand:- start:1441 stop:2304 length:864 start_codon:yes stop_codon:yes gene_type:complete